MKRTWSRLALGGAPGLVSGAIMAAVPLTGALFLAPSQYAIWALISTLATVFLLFDFGAPALATKLASEGRAGRRPVAQIIALTSVPPVILGAATMAIWPGYSAIAGLAAYMPSEVMYAIAVVAIGSALRSAANAWAAIALGRRHYGRRAAILLSGSIINASTTVCCLASGMGLFSLGYGIALGGAAALTVAVLLERKLDDAESSQGSSELIRTFFYSKGAVTLIGLTVTQLDRWAIGLTGSVDLLAQYDVLNRLIQIPKIALLTLLVGLVGEVADRGADSLVRLWAKSLIAVALVFLAPQLLLLPIAAAILGVATPSSTMIALAAGILLAQLASSLTIPSTLIFSGLGRPQFELVYLVPLFIVVVLAYGLGVYTNSGDTIVVGWVASMTVFSLLYVSFTRTFIRRAHVTRGAVSA